MKLLLLLTCIILCTCAQSQDSLWLKKGTVGEAIAFERSLAPGVTFLDQNVTVGKDFFPLFDRYRVTKPVIAQRAGSGTLPLYADYYFTPGDSVLRLVSYDWEKDEYGNFFDKQKIWEKEADSFSVYNRQYETVRAQLTRALGAPDKTDQKAARQKSDRGPYFTRESVWDNAQMHARLSMVVESMTYRVRLTYYWKD